MSVPTFAHALVISDTLVTGGQPSPREFAALAAAGFDTIVNLRPESEHTFNERAAVEALGMNYVLIPVGGPADVSFENAALLDEALKTAQRSVVHCASGNRVGALFALRAFDAGQEADEAMKVGAQHGLAGLSAFVAQKLNTSGRG